MSQQALNEAITKQTHTQGRLNENQAAFNAATNSLNEQIVNTLTRLADRP